MKLYREEDIKAIGKWASQWDLYELDKEFNSKPPMFKEFIESLTPIELPSDEEIEKECLNTYRENPSNPKEHPEWDYGKDINAPRKRKAFIKGAKWMKEQILNQDI